jgi:hypothetical protein
MEEILCSNSETVFDRGAHHFDETPKNREGWVTETCRGKKCLDEATRTPQDWKSLAAPK